MYDQSQGRFRRWYPSFGGTPNNLAHFNYAVSEDGIIWVKPNLDPFPGTNILLGPEHEIRGPSILHDTAEQDPGKRYKFLVRPGHTASVFSYVSPDGIHWNIQDRSAIRADSDSHIGLTRQPGTGRYLATMRKIKGDRRVWLASSPDFETWSEPVLVVEPRPSHSLQTQIHGMPLASYGAYLLGMVSVYHTMEDDLEG